MKKPLLILITLVFLISSCKLDEAGFKQSSVKADDAANNTSGSIVGMWLLKTQVSVGTSFGIPLNNTTPGTLKDYYLFKADNTVKISTEADGIANGTYAYNAGAKKLTITYAGTSIDYTVNILTADALTLNTKVSVPALSTELSVTLNYTH